MGAREPKRVRCPVCDSSVFDTDKGNIRAHPSLRHRRCPGSGAAVPNIDTRYMDVLQHFLGGTSSIRSTTR